MNATNEISALQKGRLNQTGARSHDYGAAIRLQQRSRAGQIARSVALPVSICDEFSDREKVVLRCIADAIRLDGAFDTSVHVMDPGCPLARGTILKAYRKATKLGLLEVHERQEHPCAPKEEIVKAKDLNFLSYFATGNSIVSHRQDVRARRSSSEAN